MKTSCMTTTSRRVCASIAAGLGSLVLAGCATGPEAHPRDPMEPFNRGVYRFNDAVDRAVLKPTAKAYTQVTPNFVQKGVRNFFSNLGDAWSTVNSILQLKGQDAANSFSRVTLNTFFGFGGVFDIATEARIPQSKQDFGLTLGRWGIPTGPYVVLPLLGPSTVRDTVALPVDMKGNPVGAVTPVGVRNTLSALSVVNYRAQMLDTTNLLEQAALDPYILMRDGYLAQRDARGGQPASAEEPAQTAGASDGYEPPPPEDGAQTGSAATPAPDAAGNAGYEPPPDMEPEPRIPAAGAQPPEAAPSAPDAAVPVAEPAQASSPLAAEPAAQGASAAGKQPQVRPPVSGQTSHYLHVVPRLVDEIAPASMGGNFWKR